MSFSYHTNPKRECSTNVTLKSKSKKSKKFESPLRKTQQNQDDINIKDFDDKINTMNELLGWYGYDKFDTTETQCLNLQRFTSSHDRNHSPPERSESVASQSKTSQSMLNIDDDESHSSSAPTSVSEGGSGGRFPSPVPSVEPDDDKQNKESSTDAQNIPPGCIICGWCQKVGMKLFTMRTTNGSKAFCSELCFTQNRRASFKKNKICDWCKHVRHTVNYVDFQNGEHQLQFCSNKCLNQYKMHIFCKETAEHLQMHPHLKDTDSNVITTGGSKLITPELWLKESKNKDNMPMNCTINSEAEEAEDSETDIVQDTSAYTVHHKRKLSDVQSYITDLNRSKESSSKEISVIKESKRSKHLNGKHSKDRHTTKYSPNSNSSQTIDLSNRESRESTTIVQPSQRHNSQFSSSNISNHPLRVPVSPQNRVSIPLLNGVSNLPSQTPIPPLPSQNSSQMFSGLSPNINRHEHIRPPQLLPPLPPALFPGAPPNMYGHPHMEMLMRMQQFPLRHPFPFHLPSNVLNGHSFPSLTQNMSINQPQQPFPNPMLNPNPIHPPSTLLPYPVVLPIPIPVPIIFPIFKNLPLNLISKSQQNNENVTENVPKNSPSNTSAPNTSVVNNVSSRKVESVITKLVERKTKSNCRNDIPQLNNTCPMNSELKTNKVINNKDNNEKDKTNSNVCLSTERQNIISRNKRCLSPYSVTNNGLRSQK